MNSQTTIFSLHYELLKSIMLLVVTSAGGGADLARTISVCKIFAKFGDDKDLLKMACFGNLALPESKHFRRINGLVNRCALAENASAQYFLAQVILVAFSELLGNESKYLKYQYGPSYTDQAITSRAANQDSTPFFLSYFMAKGAYGFRLSHYELVSSFLSRCSFLDHVSMRPYVEIYVEYFGYGNRGSIKFYNNFNSMSAILRAVVDLGRKRKMWYSHQFLRDGQIEPEMGEAQAMVTGVITSLNQRLFYYLPRHRELSRLKWEELKRECKYIAEEMLSGESGLKKVDAEVGGMDLGRRFFYYLGFNGPVINMMDAFYHPCFKNLRVKCEKIAMQYHSFQHDATLAFDEMVSPKYSI